MSSAHDLFILDTSIIRPFFTCYSPQDVFPELWNGLNKLDSRKLLISVADVKTECIRQLGKNKIAEDWIQEHSAIFTDPSEEEINIFRDFVSNPKFQLTPDEIAGNKTKADIYLVVRGKYTGGKVVTAEINKPNRRDIPKMCEMYNVECIMYN